MDSKRKSRMRQKKASTTDDIIRKKKRRENRPYRFVSMISILLFVGLCFYMTWFQQVKSESLLNSPYNKRSQKRAEKIVRGSILASDGTILAKTNVDDKGNESRAYPYGSLFAHTVGYLDYGSSGLELSQSSRLLTSHDDISSQIRSDLKDEKKMGDSVVTALQVKLQQAASDALGNNHGAVFVMDRETGQVLADVSKPTYDPNRIASDWSKLTSEENESSGIFMNRATQGLYPPGSTFKIITALAYLRQYKTFDQFRYRCTGEYTKSGFTIHCAGGKAHGEEGFEDAMADSCNCAFAYMAAEKIDPDQLRKAAEDFGLNNKLKLEVPTAAGSFTMDRNTPAQLLMQTAIGQGETQVTPMQMCMAADAVANGGKMMKPQFVQQIKSASGEVIKTLSPSVSATVMTENEADQIKNAMRKVVTDGTASYLNQYSYQIAGKTGTAQYGDIKNGTAHSWFVGFSQTGNSDIVVAVLIEDGGTRSIHAYRAAGRVFSAYFEGA